MSKLLVLCKDFNAPGGVANFVQSILTHLPDDMDATRLSIGRPTGRESFVQGLIAPIRDNFRLAKAVINDRPDLVHINPSLNWSSLLRDGAFILLLKLLRYPQVLVYFHGWREEEAQSILQSPLKKRLFVWVFSHARVICVLATRFKSVLVEMGLDAQKVEVCTTMFDTQMFQGLKRNRSDDGRRLLFLGRIVRKKGVFEVMHAFAALAPEFPDITLQIAGSGEDLELLRSEARRLGVDEKVSFPGYVTGADKAQLLLDSDLFVFPTYYPEGCPVSLLEAMAAGLPILTGSAGGIPDIVEDGTNGTVLQQVNDASVEAELRALLMDPSRCQRMGQMNRAWAWKTFSSEVVVDDIMRLYDKTMG